MMVSEEYKEYLRSDEWKEKRQEFLEDAKYECERCGLKAKQVHHLNYDNIFYEDSDDVEVLCVQCHIDAEEEKGKDFYYSGYGNYGT